MSDKNNVYEMTDVASRFTNSIGGKKKSELENRHPVFTKYMLSTSDHEIWEYINAVSMFYVERYSYLQKMNRLPSSRFWHKNQCTVLMFYRLMARTAHMVSMGIPAIGLPQKELVTFLSTSCHVSERHVLRVIDEACESGFLEKTVWWRDERVTVCYLSPISIAEYLDVGIMRHFHAAYKAGVSEANQRIDAVLDATDERQFNFEFIQHANAKFT